MMLTSVLLKVESPVWTGSCKECYRLTAVRPLQVEGILYQRLISPVFVPIQRFLFLD